MRLVTVAIGGARLIKSASRRQATNVNATKDLNLMSSVISVKTLTNAWREIIVTKTQLVSTQKAATLARVFRATLVTAKLVKKAVAQIINAL